MAFWFASLAALDDLAAEMRRPTALLETSATACPPMHRGVSVLSERHLGAAIMTVHLLYSSRIASQQTAIGLGPVASVDRAPEMALALGPFQAQLRGVQV